MVNLVGECFWLVQVCEYCVFSPQFDYCPFPMQKIPAQVGMVMARMTMTMTRIVMVMARMTPEEYHQSRLTQLLVEMSNL